MERRKQLVLQSLVFLLAVWVSYVEGQNLRQGGANVVCRQVKHEYTVLQKFTRIGYENYRSCCKYVRQPRVRIRRWGKKKRDVVAQVSEESLSVDEMYRDRKSKKEAPTYDWCLDRCTKTRTKVVSYTKPVKKLSYKTQCLCKPGWSRSGDECKTPICNPGCRRGQCVAPNSCRCESGFEGKYCEKDINECSQKKPCSQVCKNLAGTYACSCNHGYEKIDKNPLSAQCRDLDECRHKGSNKCQQVCYNQLGSYICSCEKNHKLNSDKRTCSVDKSGNTWSEWSTCTVSCGVGTHTRIIQCANPLNCPYHQQFKQCNFHPCK